MQYEYEIIKHRDGLPLRAFFVSIGLRDYHWHSDLEIIWILKGSVVMQRNIGDSILNAGDIYMLNTNEVHCLKHTMEENLILAIQVNENIVGNCYKRLSQIRFDLNYISSHYELSISLKRKMAIIMTSVIKGSPSDLMNAIGHLNLLMADLFGQIPYQEIDKNQMQIKDNDLERLKRVIVYINNNYQDKITLQDIADQEFLNRYRMSHFIKDKLGISFQNLINKVRMERALELILRTNENILSISEKCGFSDLKYLNKLLKEEYELTATGIRKQADKKQNYLFHIVDEGHNAFDSAEALKVLKNYL